MLKPSDVSCVIPTRGDCDLTPIMESLAYQGIEDIVVWDNSVREDLGIYGRYAAIAEAKSDVIVTQDDDVLIDCYTEIIAGYKPGILRVNYAEPWDVPWPASGSVFDAHLPGVAFARYYERWPHDRLFTHRICDAVFALLSDYEVVYFGHTDLPHGYHAGRVSTSEGWYDRDRPEAQRRCSELLEAMAA